MARQDKFDRLLERWSLQPEDLDVGSQVLGAGSFGEVRAGTLRDGNSCIEVAVKLLPMNGNCEETWNKIGSEAVLLAKVSERCKSTSRLYGICVKDDKFCLVMKKYVTSLEKKIGEFPDRKAPRKLVEQWALDICEAVVELHAQNVVIRDLKPSNVLVDEFDGAVLADFGISQMVERTVGQRRTSTAIAGTFAYMAPETFTTKVAERSCKVDVWSLGCLLLELHTGKAPWEGLDMPIIVWKVLILKEHPAIPSEMNRDIADAVEQCFVYDPAERASAMTILEALKRAYYQAPGNSTNFQDKCHLCSSSGTVATCLQCTLKLSTGHDTPQSLEFRSRMESLEREVEALTLRNEEAESRLSASEEKVVTLKVVIAEQAYLNSINRSRMESLEREVEALTLRNEEAESRLSASEEKVATLKVENAEQAMQWTEEMSVVELKVAQLERTGAQLSKQGTAIDEQQRLIHCSSLIRPVPKYPSPFENLDDLPLGLDNNVRKLDLSGERLPMPADVRIRVDAFAGRHRGP